MWSMAAPCRKIKYCLSLLLIQRAKSLFIFRTQLQSCKSMLKDVDFPVKFNMEYYNEDSEHYCSLLGLAASCNHPCVNSDQVSQSKTLNS